MQKLRSVSLTTAYVICRTQESKAAKSAAVKGVTNYRWLLQQADLDAGSSELPLKMSWQASAPPQSDRAFRLASTSYWPHMLSHLATPALVPSRLTAM
jgi:hypothetical protein